MSNFLHGVQVVEVDEGAKNVNLVSSSVIGVVGTAPEAKEEDFPLNAPILISGSLTEAAKLGKTGTLPKALDGILSQVGATVVVIRVDEEQNEEGEVDAEATQLNVIGEALPDGSYTGAHALLAAKSKLGLSPRILIVPGFSSTKEVATELITIANRLRAVVIADAPDGTNEEIIKFTTDCTSPRLYAVYPSVINTKGETVPASSYVAGVLAKSDNENGFWVLPSNKTIAGIVGLSKSVDFTLGDASCRANYLNEQYKDLTKFTEEVAKTAVAWRANSDETARRVGNLMKVFNVGTSQLSEYFDAFNDLGNKAGASADSILKGVTKALGGLANFKIALPQAAALTSTIISFGENAETAGAQVSTMLQRLYSLIFFYSSLVLLTCDPYINDNIFRGEFLL